MIAAARNKKAGALIVSGTFVFLFAIGINTVYSMEYVCLDVAPPQCLTGYQGLSASERMILSPGLYLVALTVVLAGAFFWFTRNPVLEANS